MGCGPSTKGVTLFGVTISYNKNSFVINHPGTQNEYFAMAAPFEVSIDLVALSELAWKNLLAPKKTVK